jgi:signal transduction histidine kinase/ActR/RegA family two-component response regulator
LGSGEQVSENSLVSARTPDPASVELRVLVLPPTTADAAAIETLLRANRIDCNIVRDVDSLCSGIHEGAGLVLISEEALSARSAAIMACIGKRPVWSDLPLIVLSRSGAESAAFAQVLPALGNVSVVERPVRMTTLISLVRSGLRARVRQYQVREHLIKQERAERAVRAAEQTERVARNEAERSNRIKDEFLATLSHELRTPLHAILGWSQLLRKSSDLSSSVADGLTVIERNARLQAQIVSDLLDMSSIISGKIRLEMERVDVARIVEAAVNTVRPAAEVKQIQLHMVLSPRVGPVRADPSRLQQVFWNLLTNAVKFTPKGGRISVTAARVKSHVEINFSDTGEGIDPDFLPYMFDRFRQGDSSIARRHGGLGLGLSIVKQLLDLHGGIISVKSEGKNAGSEFGISLPLMPTNENGSDIGPIRHNCAESAEAEAVSPLSRPDLNGLVILVVDDEPDARVLLRCLLESCHATVATAGSADEAITLLTDLSPDLIVSDIGMPRQDGYELIRRVRSLDNPQRLTPAIALTAYVRPTDRIKAIEAGYQMHLAKPVEPTELIAMVAAWKPKPDLRKLE